MYRVEFREATHEESALERRFYEETAHAIGALIFRNDQQHPFVIETIFDDTEIPTHSTSFETRMAAIEAIYDDPQAESLVTEALDSAFRKDYDALAQATGIEA